MQGDLGDMAIAELIQHNCEEHKTAMLTVKHAGREAHVYFQDGNVTHATLDGRDGEEVIFRILEWDDGTFSVEPGMSAPVATIGRSWTALLLEGARRQDEAKPGSSTTEDTRTIHQEVSGMGKMDDLLKEMGGEVTGYVASAVAGMDGINLAQHTRAKVDQEAISAQMTMLLKLIDTSITKLGAGVVEDNLVTTEKTYVLMRFLQSKEHFLAVVSDRKTGNLGNLRLVSKMYAERIAKAMPR